MARGSSNEQERIPMQGLLPAERADSLLASPYAICVSAAASGSLLISGDVYLISAIGRDVIST
jgi:hypothetical protein